jgi:hypothetical protein
MSLETKSSRVIPNCRYGHGNLKKVVHRYVEIDEQVRFAWVASRKLTMQFVGNIYTCSECGYTEFFDDEPELTAQETGVD